MARNQKVDQILTAEDYDTIMQQLARIDAMPQVFKRACASGVDCSEHEKAIAMAREGYEKLLKAWFPKGRPK